MLYGVLGAITGLLLIIAVELYFIGLNILSNKKDS